MTVELWRMQSGRIGTIDLDQSPEAVVALRALLRSQGAVPEEEGPDAGATAVEAENTLTPSQELHVNETQPTTPALPTASDVAAVFAQIDACPTDHLVILEEGDFGYDDLGAEWVRPMSELRALITVEMLREDIADGRTHWFGNWFDQDGDIVLSSARGDRWTAVEAEGMPVSQLQNTPMSAWRSPGGYLFVSGGLWLPIEETTAPDGEVAFVFVSKTELRRREDAKKTAWQDANRAALEAAKPAEATSYDCWDFDPTRSSQGVLYEREIGPVTMSWPADIEDGLVRFTTDGPEVMVQVGNQSDVVDGVDELRKLASAIMAAIPVVEAATEVQ